LGEFGVKYSPKSTFKALLSILSKIILTNKNLKGTITMSNSKQNVEKEHYIDKKELYKEIVVSKARGILSRKASYMFQLLVERMIRKLRYSNPDDKKDCMQTALFNLYDNWQSFNEEKYTNCFAYLSEISKRGMAEGFNEIHRMKGQPRDQKLRWISMDTSNEGEGLSNII